MRSRAGTSCTCWWTTGDLGLPSVWALALRADGTLPASFSAAGARPDPVAAITAAVWEVAQLVGTGLVLGPAESEPLIADPWRVAQMRTTSPVHPSGAAPRVTAGAGRPGAAGRRGVPGLAGPADPGGAAATCTGALEYLADRYRQAGLTEIVLVDQSTVEHADAGLAAVRAVVPGILPMCFGQAQQRLTGLPRLLTSSPSTGTATTGGPGDAPLDPVDSPLRPAPVPVNGPINALLEQPCEGEEDQMSMTEVRQFAFRQGPGRMRLAGPIEVDDTALTTASLPPAGARGDAGQPLPLGTHRALAAAAYPAGRVAPVPRRSGWDTCC